MAYVELQDGSNRGVFRGLLNGMLEELYTNQVSANAVLYVDTVNGSDANVGSESSPIQSWAKVFDLVQTGDYIGGKIKVARGSVFTPTLMPDPADVPVTSGHGNGSSFPMGGLATCIDWSQSYWRGVTVEPYGEGMSPIFDLRTTLTNANFTLVGGTTNVYQISFNRAQNNNGTSVYGGIWENNAILPIQAYLNRASAPSNNFTTLANVLTFLDANPGSFYFDYTTSTTVNTYYVHVPGSGNPSTNGKTYKARYFDWFACGTEGNLLHKSRAGITLKGLTIIGNANHNGAVWGPNIDMIDCTVLEFARHGVMVHGYIKETKVMFGGTEGGGCFHAFSEFTGQRRGTVYEDCVAVGWKDPNNKSQTIAGFFYHAAAGATLKELRYVRCKVYNNQTAWELQSGIEVAKMIDCEVKGCSRLIYNINPIGSVRCKITFERLRATLPNNSSFGETRETQLNIVNSNIYQSGSFGHTLRLAENAELNIIGSRICFDGSTAAPRIRLVDLVNPPTIRIINSVVDEFSGIFVNLIKAVSGVSVSSSSLIIDKSVIGDNASKVEDITDFATLRAAYTNVTANNFWSETITWRGYPQLNQFIPESSNMKTYSSGYGDGLVDTRGIQLYEDIPVTFNP